MRPTKGFAIIQTARIGESLGITTLALVDRAKSKRLWWTSDDPDIAICYQSEAAARFAAGRLKYNRVRVVPWADAVVLLRNQRRAVLACEIDRAQVAAREFDGMTPREIDDIENERMHEAAMEDAFASHGQDFSF